MVVGCGSTEPSAPSTSYDFTATFNQFSFETPAPSPPDCPASGSNLTYCTHLRPTTMGSLTGVLTISEPTSEQTSDSVSALLSGHFCTGWTVDQGCTAVGPDTTAHYVGAISRGALLHVSLQVADPFGAYATLSNVVETPDSLSGDLNWALHVDRSPPSLYGHFVARRRP
jgi:hypothetical protein